MDKLKHLFSRKAWPGWVFILWSTINFLHTLTFIREIAMWAVSHGKWITSPVGNTLILLVGLGWLFVATRKGGDTPQPVLAASSQGTNEELINFKKQAIFISPSTAYGAVTLSERKNKITVECFILTFTTIFTDYIEVKIRSDTSDLLEFTTRKKFSVYAPNTGKLTLEHTIEDEDHRENLEKFFNATTPDTPVNVELYIEFSGPEIGHSSFRRILRTLLIVT